MAVVERGVERVLIDDTTSRDALISNAPSFINARQPTLSRRGTEGSNLAPSSGESDANLTNTRRNGDRQAGRGYRSKAAKTALSPFI